MFFNHPFFRQQFQGGGRDMAAGGGGPFRAVYKAYSAAFLTDRDRSNVENGGKILLPQAALEQLVEQSGVMLFKLKNKKLDRVTHCGVIEFLPNDNEKCYLPNWMMGQLLLQQGDEINVESVSLPTARFALFQPQSKDFLDITNKRAVLETALRNFSCLTKGDLIALNYLNRNYELCVLELKPADAVTIIECDMEVDFALPIDSIEPKAIPTSQNLSTTPKPIGGMALTPGDPQLSIPSGSFKSPSSFTPFHGHGSRLDGKIKTKDQEQHQPQISTKQTRGIPNYDYEYGTVQFIRAPLRSVNNETEGGDGQNLSSQFQPFSGEGQMLKQPKNQRPK